MEPYRTPSRPLAGAEPGGVRPSLGGEGTGRGGDPELPALRQQKLAVRGLLLGGSIGGRSQGGWERRDGKTAVVKAGRSGRAVILRYGVVVLFGVSAEEEEHFVADLMGRVVQPLDRRLVEEIHADVGLGGREGVREDGIVLLATDDDNRLRVVAEVVGKSLVLEEHEERMARVVERVAPMASELAERGRISGSERELRSRIGEALVARHRLLGAAGIKERPDVLWEHTELNELYDRLEREFEIKERTAALESKAAIVSDAASTVLGLAHSKRSHALEWGIVALIVMELLLSLHQAFVH